MKIHLTEQKMVRKVTDNQTILSKTELQALGKGDRKSLMICLMISWMG